MKVIRLFLNDVIASLQASFYNTTGNVKKERESLERVIAARSQYLSPTHGSVGQVKAELGATYFSASLPIIKRQTRCLQKHKKSLPIVMEQAADAWRTFFNTALVSS